MYEKLFNVLSIFDIPSDVIIGAWSLVMLIGSGYSIYKTHEISTPIACMFSTVITGFAGHRIATILKGNNTSEDK